MKCWVSRKGTGDNAVVCIENRLRGWSYAAMWMSLLSIVMLVTSMGSSSPISLRSATFDARQGEPYLEAHRLEQAGEWERALERFEQLASSRSDFADYALLGAARCYREVGELDRARSALDELLSRFPASPGIPYARLELGRVFADAGLLEESATQIEEALGIQPSSIDKTEALYMLGSLYAEMGSEEKALRTFERLCKLAPRSDQALLGAEYLAGTGGISGKLDAIRVFAPQKRHETVIGICEQLLEDPSVGERRAGIMLDLARAYTGANRPDDAIETYEAVTDQFPDTSSGAQALLESAWLSERRGYGAEALWMRQRVRNEYPGTLHAVQAQWDLARSYERGGMTEEAVAQYAKLGHDHPDSFLADDALFRAGVMSYLSEDYARAAELFVEATNVAADRLVDDAPYWAGKAYLASGKSHIAAHYLSRSAQVDPPAFCSYRAWAALRQLSAIGFRRAYRVPIGKKWLMILPARLSPGESTRNRALFSASPLAGLSEEAQRLATRANFLLRHQLPEADWDLDRLILAVSPGTPSVRAQLFLYVEAFDRCVDTAERASATPDGRTEFADFLPYLYPLAHVRQVHELVSGTEIDPFIIHAVMREESRLNWKLVSGAGAVGLMQIMPGTGRWIASRMELEGYDEESLDDRDVNLRLGVGYLNYLWDEFDGVLVHVLAAYNAGPGNVKKWLEAGTGSEDVDVFIETIPFEETRNYVKKVLGAYGNYIQLYK